MENSERQYGGWLMQSSKSMQGSLSVINRGLCFCLIILCSFFGAFAEFSFAFSKSHFAVVPIRPFLS